MTMSLHSSHREFLSRALSEVSRSFALVIPSLEPPLEQVVGVAYLICRVCDNIEDCLQPLSWKQERWQEFEQMLTEPELSHVMLPQWGTYSWPGLTEAERALMGVDGQMLWNIVALLPEQAVVSIRHWAMVMARGMETMLSEQAPIVWRSGISILRNLQAFDEYCYYVAGTVGHMCTELLAFHYGWHPSLVQPLEERANAFGRALQKTNILKDFARDLQRGVSYFPSEWMKKANDRPLHLQGAEETWCVQVMGNILDELSTAVEYIVTLPMEALGYRRFCLRAVLPAYETMLSAASRLDTLFTHDHEIKIERAAMMQCMVDAESFAQNNQELLAAREQYMQKIEACFVKAAINRDGLHSATVAVPSSKQSTQVQATTNH